MKLGIRSRRALLASAVVLGLLILPAGGETRPRPLKEETFRCSSSEWTALQQAIHAFCSSHPAQCEINKVLEMCQPTFRGVTISRERDFVLRLDPDCWNYLVSFSPPTSVEQAVRAFRQRRLSELLRDGWQIQRVVLDISHCD